MKTLLAAINAKFIHTNCAVRYLKHYTENLYTENLNCEIKIIETTINNRAEKIIREIYLENPDIIAFSCYIWNIEMVLKLCKTLKKIMPKVKIILGGPEVSYSAFEILDDINYYNQIDFIISGEGEIPFSELIFSLANNRNYKGIGGISFRDSDVIISNPPPAPFDLSQLPFAYHGEFGTSSLDGKIIYYEASRGCPFRCSYCLSSAENNGVRFVPIEKVKSELLVFLDKKVPQVKFVDRTFNCNRGFALEIIEFLIRNDNNVTNFHFEVEAFVLDESIICLLKTARKGLFQLEIGVQTTNPRTLNAVNRIGEFEKIKSAVGKLKENSNMHIHLDLIAGLPFEDFFSFRKSFNDVFSLNPDQLQLGFLKMLKGSGIRNNLEFNVKFDDYAPYEILENDFLSFSEILELKDIEDATEVYYNSGRFVNSMKYLMEKMRFKFGTPFDFFQGIAEFKRKMSSFYDGDLGKLIPYKILLEFTGDILAEVPMELRFLMRFDMLLHEKLSNVPTWLGIESDSSFSEQSLKRFNKNGILSELIPQLEGLQSRQISKIVHVEKFDIDPISHKNEPRILLFYYGKKSSTEVIDVTEK